jgi:serine/threonine protein kinase
MASPATPLPPVVFQDGLGQRRRVIGARNQILSVLFLDGELTATPGFESALRDRITRFAAFQHDSFARARGVVHLSKAPLRLALASDFVEGIRLSEMLALAEQRLIPLEINAAFGVIRQLAPALAALHEHAPDTCHGALAPERIVITEDARVMVAEHVLGPSMEQLFFSPQRYWQEFRIPLPPNGGVAHFDLRADVTQLGAIALALILGRPLRDDEYPARVPEIVDGVRAVSATGLEQLPAGVHAWLRRALQLDPRRSFASAIEAHAELDGIYDVDDDTARAALKSFVDHCHAALAHSESSLSEEAIPAAVTSHEESEPGTRDSGFGIRGLSLAPRVANVEDTVRSPESRILSLESRVPSPESRLPSPEFQVPSPASRMPSIFPSAESTERTATPREEVTSDADASLDDNTDTAERSHSDEYAEQADVPTQRNIAWRRFRVPAIAAMIIAVASVGTFAARRYLASEPVGTLIVNTNPTGVTVVIDGQHRGSTPLTVDLKPGRHLLQIVNDGHVRAIPVTIAEGREVAQFIELPDVAPAPQDGHLQVRTEPAGARVVIDGQYRGVSPLTIEGLTPGAHTVKLEDASASVTEQVTIEAGATASLVVPLGAPRGVPVSGWISVVAPVDVQIYENRRLLGSNKSEQIMVSAGRHELEIVNDALGYRLTRTVQVTAGNTAVVKLEWPKGSLALNATPWAEVWVDGERLGETPLGNVVVPIGAHRVVFRHPELGEQTHNITVTLTAPARVSADMRTR